MTFNLRTMLGLVTVFCLVVYLLTAAPPLVAGIGLFVYVVLQTTFFVTGAFYAGPNLKAFCRGALLPALIDYMFVMWVFVQVGIAFDFGDLRAAMEMDANEGSVVFLRRTTIMATALSVLIGLATLVFKRLVEPRPPARPDGQS